ncbi:MAG: PHP domain-containing protein [Actinomycetota bacterium]
MQWPEEVTEVMASGRELTELRAIGKWTARIIQDWLEDPPELPDPPEPRAGFMTLAHARKTIEEHPEWREALRGDLQMHTTWSDGHESIRDMADHAASQGHEYTAITDHSKGLPIANGMDEEELLRQGGEIDQVNEQLASEGSGFRLLRAIEMNLSPEGDGDMDPDVLAGLDLVLGAFHSKLRVTDDQTARYVAAVRNPTVHVLAHPRTRRWGSRKGLYADWPKVFEAAAEAGTALEIDAHAERQDLQVDVLEVARETPGLWISIGTDAHYPHELDFIDIGLAAAIESGFPRERILNFLPRDQLLAKLSG